ncbi:MAG TPA: lipopolysaccharide kinase InaA family protein [Candidatus Binataceae bacterium]|nr:lipopolysaccharide kinase InaA family protein [Candidatus Binataceae bacterium]
MKLRASAEAAREHVKGAANSTSGGAIAGPDAEFRSFALGRRILYLRNDLSAQVAGIFALLSGLGLSTEGVGNRASGVPLSLESGPQIFARIARRGGLARFLLKDLYIGQRPRPIRELAIAAEAYRRGVPVAEPFGAMVEWVAPIAYRGIFLTRALSGLTLWEFVRTDDDRAVRDHVLAQARRAIDTMHRQGLIHADLNLHNLLVTTAGERFNVVILDLDKARLVPGAVSAAMRERNLARLRRSARKLDPRGRFLDAAAIALLCAK